MSKAENNKRILKNTALLYLRMGLSMIVSLLSVKIILNNLGVIDYGIYDVIGGVVTMFSFLTASLSSASLRFLSYDLGKQNKSNIQTTFSTILFIFTCLASTIFVLCEVLGLYFFKSHINIPLDRYFAAQYVFHFSLISFILSLLSIPLSSLLISYEKMGSYAFITLADTFLKLLAAILIPFFQTDRLITYSILITIVSILTLIAYYYISINISPIKLKIKPYDKSQIKEMASYLSWNLFGSISAMFSNQGINLIINVFFGPIANAARAIAYRVNVAIQSFSINFYTAVNPRIIKSYAEGDTKYQLQLVFYSSKIAYFMLLLIIIPIYLELNNILQLWLGSATTELTTELTKLSMIFTLVCSLENPLTTLIRATGNIKKYQLYVGSFTLLSLPATYLFFKLGFDVLYSYYTLIIIYSIALFVRLYILKIQLNFPIQKYITTIIIPIITITLISFIICTYALQFYSNFHLIIRIIITIFILSIIIFLSNFIILNKKEKVYIKKIIQNKIKKG